MDLTSFTSALSGKGLLNCSVCWEQPQPPHTLACLHSICEGCFEGLKELRCPCCRAPIEGELPVPHPFLARLISEQKDGDKFDPNDIQCGLCEDEEAKVACADCSTYYCNGCSESHLRIPVCKSHRITSIEDALANPTVAPAMCSTHNLALTRFCQPCNIAVCSDCALDFHYAPCPPMHQIERLSEVAPILKKRLEEEVLDLSQEGAYLTRSLQEIHTALDQLEDRAEEAKEQILREKWRLIRDIDDEQVISTNEEELLTQVKLRTHSQRKNLDLGKENIEFTLQGVRASHTFGTALLSTGNDAEIATNFRSFDNRYQTLVNDLAPKAFIEWGQLMHFQPGPLRILNLHAGLPTPLAHLPSARFTDVNEPWSFNIEGTDRPIFLKATGPGPLSFIMEIPQDRQQQVIVIPSMPGTYKITAYGNGIIHNTPFELNVGKQPPLNFGRHGSGDGELNYPECICTNSKNDIIVGDFRNNRIQVFDDKGKFLFKFGSYGSGPGEFVLSHTVLCTPNDEIVVSDSENCRIQVFDQKGAFLRTVGHGGKDKGELRYPRGICLDRDNNLLIADSFNKRIETFTLAGEHKDSFNLIPFNLYRPDDVGVLSNGTIIISSRWSVDAFDSNKNPLWKVDVFSTTFTRLFIDPQDRIFLKNDQYIQMLSKLGENLKKINTLSLRHACVDSNGRVITCSTQPGAEGGYITVS